MRILRITCFIVLAGLSLGFGLMTCGDVCRKRELKRAQVELVAQLKFAKTKDQVMAILGPPSRIVEAPEALQLARQFAGTRLKYERYQSYPQALVYFRGQWVYFVYLDATNGLADCLVVSN